MDTLKEAFAGVKTIAHDLANNVSTMIDNISHDSTPAITAKETMLNAQGVAIEVPAPSPAPAPESAPTPAPALEKPAALEMVEGDITEADFDGWGLLDGTILSTPNYELNVASTEQLESKIISWGHVLKSTHDLAQWKEKRTVNNAESMDSLGLVARNQAAITGDSLPRPQQQPQQQGAGAKGQSGSEGSKQIQGQGQGRAPNQERAAGGMKGSQTRGQNRGRTNFGRSQRPEINEQWKRADYDISLSDTPLSTNNTELIESAPSKEGSKIVSVGHEVLKSTHDMAQWSEKKGARCVNQQASGQELDQLISNQDVDSYPQREQFMQSAQAEQAQQPITTPEEKVGSAPRMDGTVGQSAQ